MDIEQNLLHMQSLMTPEGWRDIEPAYLRTLRACDATFAAEASAVRLGRYSEELGAMLAAGVCMTEDSETRALYFEFDLDNGWDGSLFLCTDYQDESAGDDSWAGEWTEYVVGPGCEALSALYTRTDGVLARSPEDVARVSYLLARTLAAFTSAVVESNVTTLPVCIAYHDQAGVLRVRRDPVSTVSPQLRARGSRFVR